MITRACPALGALLLGASGEVFGLRWPTLVACALALAIYVWGRARKDRIEAVLEGPPEDGDRR
jgi:hypothetical protein